MGGGGRGHWAVAGRALQDVPLLLDYARWYHEALPGGEAQVHREVPEALPRRWGPAPAGGDRRGLGGGPGAGPLGRTPTGVGEGEAGHPPRGDASLERAGVRPGAGHPAGGWGWRPGGPGDQRLPPRQAGGQREGHPHSVDLPQRPSSPGARRRGRAAKLRQRWRYHWGLPAPSSPAAGLWVARWAGCPQSDHRYALRWEMEALGRGWPPGAGWWSTTPTTTTPFGTSPRRQAPSPWVRQEGEAACTGLLRKPLCPAGAAGLSPSLSGSRWPSRGRRPERPGRC